MDGFSFQLPSTPSFSAPSFDFSFSTPSFSLPSFSTPSFDFSTPSIALPTFQTPSFDFQTPTFETPSFEAPSFSLPEPVTFTPLPEPIPIYGPGAEPFIPAPEPVANLPVLEPFTEYQPLPTQPVFVEPVPIMVSNPQIPVAPPEPVATTPSMATTIFDSGSGDMSYSAPSFDFKLPESSFELPVNNYFADQMFQVPDFSSNFQTYDFGAIASGNYDFSIPQIPEITAPSISEMYSAPNFSFTTPLTDAVIADLGDTNTYLENFNFNFNTPPLSPETIAAIEQDASYEAAVMASKTFGQTPGEILANIGINEISSPAISTSLVGLSGTGSTSPFMSPGTNVISEFLKPSPITNPTTAVATSVQNAFRPATPTNPPKGSTASSTSGSGGLDSLLKGLSGLGNSLAGLLTGRGGGGGGGSSGGGAGAGAGAGSGGTAGSGQPGGTTPRPGTPGTPGGTQVADTGAKWPWILFGIGALLVLSENEKKGKGGGTDSLASVSM